MSAKAMLVFCAHALFIQSILSQCTSPGTIDASGFGSPYGRAGSSMAAPMAYERMVSPGLSYDGRGSLSGRGLGCDGYITPAMKFSATSGGGLPITSFSAISPTGISIISENAYKGPVSVIGDLPFVSVVAMDGLVPSVGAGSIDYGCGNGFIGMLSDGTGPAFAPNAGIAPGAFAPGSGFGPGAAFSLGNGFGPATVFSPAAGFAPANRIGCGCGRGMLY